MAIDSQPATHPIARHHPRLDWSGFAALAGATNDSLLALGQVIEAGGLDARLLTLVKLRASQLNGCAFCVQYHLGNARRLGIAQEVLDLVAVWRHAGCFSVREHAALAYAEELTALVGGTVSDPVYAGVAAAFTPGELAHLTAGIALANLWNRIGAAYRFPSAAG